jgi:hypothetical protein
MSFQTPDNQFLYPDASQRIMSLMRSTFGAEGDIFASYYLGLPDFFIPPQDAFPMMIVDKVGGTYKVGPTTADDITEEVYIHILVDIKSGFGKPEPDSTVKRQLQVLVEGRDPSTGYLLPTSVLSALRTNITLNSTAVPGLITINQNVEVSYDAPPRPNLSETREAVVSVSVIERQVVLNRR